MEILENYMWRILVLAKFVVKVKTFPFHLPFKEFYQLLDLQLKEHWSFKKEFFYSIMVFAGPSMLTWLNSLENNYEELLEKINMNKSFAAKDFHKFHIKVNWDLK